MNEMQASSEESEGGKGKLWTYLSLGITIGTLFLLMKRDTRKQRERATEESVITPDINSLQGGSTQDSEDIQSQLVQLNKTINGMSERSEKVDRGLRSGWLIQTGVGLTGVGLALFSIAHFSATPLVLNMSFAVPGVVAALFGYALILGGSFLSGIPRRRK